MNFKYLFLAIFLFVVSSITVSYSFDLKEPVPNPQNPNEFIFYFQGDSDNLDIYLEREDGSKGIAGSIDRSSWGINYQMETYNYFKEWYRWDAWPFNKKSTLAYTDEVPGKRAFDRNIDVYDQNNNLLAHIYQVSFKEYSEDVIVGDVKLFKTIGFAYDITNADDELIGHAYVKLAIKVDLGKILSKDYFNAFTLTLKDPKIIEPHIAADVAIIDFVDSGEMKNYDVIYNNYFSKIIPKPVIFAFVTNLHSRIMEIQKLIKILGGSLTELGKELDDKTGELIKQNS
ncbi:MAG: hypothetical protein ABIA04_01185 [Pseudomonadota bacterium]